MAVALYRRPAGAVALRGELAADPGAFTENLRRRAAALYQEGAKLVPLSEGLGVLAFLVFFLLGGSDSLGSEGRRILLRNHGASLSAR